MTEAVRTPPSVPVMSEIVASPTAKLLRVGSPAPATPDFSSMVISSKISLSTFLTRSLPSSASSRLSEISIIPSGTAFSVPSIAFREKKSPILAAGSRGLKAISGSLSTVKSAKLPGKRTPSVSRSPASSSLMTREMESSPGLITPKKTASWTSCILATRIMRSTSPGSAACAACSARSACCRV